MQTIADDLLSRVTGGGRPGTLDFLYENQPLPPYDPADYVKRMPYHPGSPSAMPSRPGKSLRQQVDDNYDHATRAMRTFNDTFGWTSRRQPGFGAGY